MTKFHVEGERTFMRIDDVEGQLVAYVGGSSLQQCQERANQVVKALNEPPPFTEMEQVMEAIRALKATCYTSDEDISRLKGSHTGVGCEQLKALFAFLEK